MSEQVASPSLSDELNDWGETLPGWKRYALFQIVKEGDLRDEALVETYDLLLKETGLLEKKKEYPTIPDRVLEGADNVDASPIKLTRLSKCIDVNKLDPTQGINFGDTLTVVYGRNGSGKSGYGRVLANACFSRHKPSLLADVHNPPAAPSQSAEFRLVRESAEIVVEWSGQSDENLQRFSVFDGQSTKVYIDKESPFGFRPARFDVFTKLASAMSKLSTKLDIDKASRRSARDFQTSFLEPSTEVTAAIAQLPGSLKTLETLGVFGESEKQRLLELDRLRAELEKGDTSGYLADLARLKAELEAARLSVQRVADLISIGSVTAINAEIEDLKVRSTRLLETIPSEASFLAASNSEHIEHFVASAKATAISITADYPVEGAPCILCARPLDNDAVSAIRALFGFLTSKEYSEVEEVRKKLKGRSDILDSVSDIIFKISGIEQSALGKVDGAANDRLLKLEDKLKSAVSSLSGAIKSRVSAVTVKIKFEEDFDSLMKKVENNIATAKEGDKVEALKKVADERNLLRHRQELSQLLPEIKTYLADQKWITDAEVVAAQHLSTRSITDKEKLVMGNVLGGEYRSILATEAKNLRCDTLGVSLETKGRAGQTVKTLSIGADAALSEVLSDGEQRAIALADFLAEVTVNKSSAGIIFDDPVTSLDSERKLVIAKRLVEESKSRQVIIFTHDIVFLSVLLDECDDAKLDAVCHWVESENNSAGHVRENDSPASVREFRNTARAEQTLSKAKAASGSDRVVLLQQAAGELRRCLEENLQRVLFRDVVARYRDHIKFTLLDQVVITPEMTKKFVAAFEETSKYIAGHLRSDETEGPAVEVADLERCLAMVKEAIKIPQPAVASKSAHAI